MRCVASAVSFRVSSRCMASSITSRRLPAGRNMDGAAPTRSATAMYTFSRTESRRNSRLIWNVRAMPSLTRWAWTTPVMSRPLSSTAPEVGWRTPVSRLTNVVLPAPFGPIRAWRAPASSRKSTSRVAISAPKFRHKPRVSSSGAVMTPRAGGAWSSCARLGRRGPSPATSCGSPCALHDPEDAVPREQGDDDEQEAQSELPGGGVELRQEVRQHHVGDGADEGAVQPAVAAQHEDDEHRGRAVEAERSEVDVGVRLRPDATRDAGDRRRERVAEDEPRPDRRPDGVHPQRVLADARQALAEGRKDQRAQ